MSIDGNLRPIFRDKLRDGFHWQSIETGGTGRGIPDSNFCCDGVEGWVEFKSTEAWSVDLSPEQCGWHLSRQRHGGRTFVAVRRRHEGGPRKGEGVDELWLYSGKWVRELLTNGLKCTVRPVGVWSGGPARWRWEEIRLGLIVGKDSRPLEGGLESL